jgi:hypothetical protein
MCAASQLLTLWEIMKRFDAAHFSLVSTITSALDIAGLYRPLVVRFPFIKDTDWLKKGENLEKLSGTFKLFETQCRELDLSASVAAVQRLRVILADPNCKQKDIEVQCRDIGSRVFDELNGRFFCSLTASEARLYDAPTEGWTDVIDRFPATISDIEEMNKCFAFARYTASMFHALHVAEWGAIYLGDHIGVTDPKKGWGPTEKRLREIIKAGHSAMPASMACSFQFLEQMHREIDSMVLAWRHKVDHAANHLHIVPNTEFTPEIAEHIIGAVKIFMQRLAEGIPPAQP